MALWKEDLVVKNKFSRPAFKLLGVKGVVVHWTANPGASDTGHQSYFDGADGGGSRYAGAHIFVDSDSATLIVPLNEVAYHANEKPTKVAKLKATASYYTGGNANLNTIGLEMCVEKDGTIHKNTVKRSAEIVAELCKKYNLNPLTDVYRHYDITGKNCPAPWVSKPSEFTAFKKTVNELVGGKSNTATKPSVNTSTHKVVSGDTLSEIAVKYGTTVANIKKLNGLTSDLIKVGQVLKLKGSATTSKPAEKKPVVKPAEKKESLPSDVYGTVKVIVGSLNVREKADFNSKIVKVAKKNQSFKVYAQKNGLYHLGGKQYVTANTKYVTFTKNPNYGKSTKTKVLTVLASQLYTYKTANWNNKGQIVKKGEVFTIKKELTVDGSKMYQLKSGLYITANTKYVKVSTK